MEDVIVLSGKADDMKHAIVQYKDTNKRFPKIVLINIPRSFDDKYISYTGLEAVKDMFFFSGKYEGGMICGPSPHVMIFANRPPTREAMSADRWRIFDIVDLHLVEVHEDGRRTHIAAPQART